MPDVPAVILFNTTRHERNIRSTSSNNVPVFVFVMGLKEALEADNVCPVVLVIDRHYHIKHGIKLDLCATVHLPFA